MTTPIKSKMTKGEREELSRLVRTREKVMKSSARERSSSSPLRPLSSGQVL